jgi:hypothetical protein
MLTQRSKIPCLVAVLTPWDGVGTPEPRERES